VSAVSEFECSRSKQLEMKTAGNRLCGLLYREFKICGIAIALGMSVIKRGCN
jgi:hypothetical protein